jgi:hypothetical protein
MQRRRRAPQTLPGAPGVPPRRGARQVPMGHPWALAQNALYGFSMLLSIVDCGWGGRLLVL